MEAFFLGNLYISVFKVTSLGNCSISLTTNPYVPFKLHQNSYLYYLDITVIKSNVKTLHSLHTAQFSDLILNFQIKIATIAVTIIGPHINYNIIILFFHLFQETNSDLDPVLDRAAPERAAAVAGPRAHADGLAAAALLLHVVGARVFHHFRIQV